MTERQLLARVEFWQRKLLPLGVAHFRIEGVHIVDRTPGGARANATVHLPDHYDSAEFWFQTDYIAESEPDDIDRTIIHEWVHVAMRDFDRSLEAVETWMPEQTYNDFEEVVDHEREGLVERFARTIHAAYAA